MYHDGRRIDGESAIPPHVHSPYHSMLYTVPRLRSFVLLVYCIVKPVFLALIREIDRYSEKKQI